MNITGINSGFGMIVLNLIENYNKYDLNCLDPNYMCKNKT